MKVFPFYEGINIIDCNKLSKDKYIIRYKNNTNVDISKSFAFLFFDILQNKFNEKVYKYNCDMKDNYKNKFLYSYKSFK